MKTSSNRFVVASLALALFVMLLAWPRAARAEPEDPKIAEARAQYVRGNELAKGAQWAQALAAFERSRELRPHPLTTYNVAICERALGNLLRARGLFAASIKEGTKDPTQFPASRVEDARTYIAEIDASVVHLDVRAQPEDALLAIDGRPLERVVGDDGQRTFPQSKVLALSLARANAAERAALKLAKDTRVIRIRRLRSIKGAPVIVENIALPEPMFPGLAAMEPPNNLYGLYAMRFGVTVASTREQLKAVSVCEADAEALGATPGVPALKIDRLALSLERQPVEWRVSVCLTEKLHYLSELR